MQNRFPASTAAASFLVILPALRQFAAAQIVYQTDLDDPHSFTGTGVPNGPNDFIGVTSEQAYSGSYSLNLGPGYWYTPYIPAPANNEYYLTTFQGLNPDNNPYVAYGAMSAGFLRTGPGWQTNFMVGRIEGNASNSTFMFYNNGTTP